jgi:hypothetical protein
MSFKYYLDDFTLLLDQTDRYYYTTYDDELSIRDREQQIGAEVYPNPAADQVSISIPELEGTATIGIHTLDGKQVMQVQSRQKHLKLQTAALPRGVYLVYIQTSKGNAIRKLTLQ